MARFRTSFSALLLVLLVVTAGFGADLTTSLKAGKADLKSAGALTFGTDGVLFVGDSLGAAIYAIDTQDRTAPKAAVAVDIKGIGEKIAAVLGTAPDQILINDLATNPLSKNVYLSITRGRGTAGQPVIVRVDAAGKIEPLALDNVKYSRVMLPNPAGVSDGQNQRLEAITDLAFVENQIYVAGLSNEEFSSNLRAIPFPFVEAGKGASIEIWHGSHGRFETNSPVRTFVPYKIKNETNILAAYTCTPLVKLPVAQLKPGAKVKGTTIAELGAGNRPLDMIVYNKGGRDFILMANNSRGVMKLSAENLDSYKPITAPSDIAGVPYQSIQGLKGVEQLDSFDEGHAVILSRDGSSSELKTIALP
jgi:hypothetical protein